MSALNYKYRPLDEQDKDKVLMEFHCWINEMKFDHINVINEVTENKYWNEYRNKYNNGNLCHLKYIDIKTWINCDNKFHGDNSNYFSEDDEQQLNKFKSEMRNRCNVNHDIKQLRTKLASWNGKDYDSILKQIKQDRAQKINELLMSSFLDK